MQVQWGCSPATMMLLTVWKSREGPCHNYFSYFCMKMGRCRLLNGNHPLFDGWGHPNAGRTLQVPTDWGIHEDVYCAGNDGTFQFLETVLKDVVDIFPFEYIHIGSDECPKVRQKVEGGKCRKNDACII